MSGADRVRHSVGRRRDATDKLVAFADRRPTRQKRRYPVESAAGGRMSDPWLLPGRAFRYGEA